MMDMALMSALALPPLPALARIAGFMLTAPPFSTQLAPKSAKLGFALALWLAMPFEPIASAGAPNWGPLTSLGLTELIAGLSLGFMVQIAFTAFDVVGELASNGMGLSFPGSFDPIALESAGPISGLVQLAGISLFIAGGGLEATTAYLVQSHDILPYGDVPTLETLRRNSLSVLTQAIMLGVTNSLALWGSLLLANAMMLIAARLAGGLNLMSSGLPLLLLIGLLLVALLLVPTLNGIWSQMPHLYPTYEHVGK